jgi:hypothetical protein
MRHTARLVFLSLSVAIAAPVHAQLTASGVAADSTPAIPRTVDTRIDETRPASAPAASTTSGAPLTGLRAGVHAREATQPSAPLAADHANLGQSRAMMVVGVAAVIVGAIIGGTPGTLIMVGGALVGLKGLYDYLQ